MTDTIDTTDESGRIGMTADDALMKLHDHFAAQAGGSPSYVEMTADERKAYNTEAKRRQRERERELKARGELAATDTNVRHVLADAALMLLAANRPGAAQVRYALQAAFPDKPGLPMTLEHRAKAGTFAPKVVDPARMAAVAEAESEAREAAKAAKAEKVVAASAQRARIPPPAMLPNDDQDDGQFEVPLFLRRAHGEA